MEILKTGLQNARYTDLYRLKPKKHRYSGTRLPFFSDDVYIEQAGENGTQGFCVDVKICVFIDFYASFGFYFTIREYLKREYLKYFLPKKFS
jgi:hypothetical protein